MKKYIKISDEQIKKIALEELSALKAAAKLGIRYDTFRRHAKRLNVFHPNQAGKGVKHPNAKERKLHLHEILEGKHPHISSNDLRKKLFKYKIKEPKCEICGITEWLGERISLELDHINGNRNDHILSNLRILCPNCHSQTKTYRGRNSRKH